MTGLVIILWLILIIFVTVAVVLIGVIISLTRRIKHTQANLRQSQQQVDEAMSLASTVGSVIAMVAGLAQKIKRTGKKK